MLLLITYTYMFTEKRAEEVVTPELEQSEEDKEKLSSLKDYPPLPRFTDEGMYKLL